MALNDLSASRSRTSWRKARVFRAVELNAALDFLAPASDSRESNKKDA